jgi:hypothetical protein
VRGGPIGIVFGKQRSHRDLDHGRFLVDLPPVSDLLLCAKHLFVAAKLWSMGCTHHAARRFEQRCPMPDIGLPPP